MAIRLRKSRGAISCVVEGTVRSMGAPIQVEAGGPTKKAYRAGTHRSVDPERTLERVRPFLPAMGITRIANITGLDRVGVHVVQAVRPNSRTLAVSQGKGADLAAAKASAVMESIEAYHSDHITIPV